LRFQLSALILFKSIHQKNILYKIKILKLLYSPYFLDLATGLRVRVEYYKGKWSSGCSYILKVASHDMTKAVQSAYSSNVSGPDYIHCACAHSVFSVQV
jgi:hypothetical protein